MISTHDALLCPEHGRSSWNCSDMIFIIFTAFPTFTETMSKPLGQKIGVEACSVHPDMMQET